MKEKIKRVRVTMVTVMLMFLLGMGIVLSGGNADTAKAASKKPKLNKTKIELTKGETFKLKLSNSKNVKWSSNKKSVANVDKKGKVTAKKKGNAVISAKYLKKIYKCKVKVVEEVNTKNDEKKAIDYLNNAVSNCEIIMDSIYGSWYFQVYKARDYFNEFILTPYSAESNIPSNDVSNIIVNKYGATEGTAMASYIQVLSYNLDIVHTYYEDNGTFALISKYLQDAKDTINSLGNDSTKKEKLQKYYSAVNTYYDYVYNPTGSFAKLGDKQETLREDVKACQEDLSWD